MVQKGKTFDQMNDRQGEFIDGTERAPQWRRPRSKPRPAPDAPQARSNAPKNIAGSLLVPAEMLTGVPAIDQPNGDPHGSTAAPPDDPAPVVTTSASEPAHQNPFLAPDAAAAEHAGRAAPRWRTRTSQRRAGLLIAVAIALAVLIGARLDGSATTHRMLDAPRTMVGLSVVRLAGIDGAIRAATAIFAGLRTAEAHIARPHRTRPRHRGQSHKHSLTSPRHKVTLAASQTRASGSETSSYTPPPARSTSAASTQAARPVAAPHKSTPPGPTGSGPLGGIGTCVKGCT